MGPVTAFWFVPFLLLTYTQVQESLLPKTAINFPKAPAVEAAPAVPRAPNTGAVQEATAYYPKASPSTNYITPEKTLTFSGEGFVPGELISLSRGNDFITSWYANNQGTFSNRGAYTIPFDLQGDYYFKIEGLQSNYPVTIHIVVGTYYPNLTPSSYYVRKGAYMSASGTRFAPGEAVTLRVNGITVATVYADSSGRVEWNFFAPYSGQEFELSAHGLSSETSSERTITLVQ